MFYKCHYWKIFHNKEPQTPFKFSCWCLFLCPIFMKFKTIVWCISWFMKFKYQYIRSQGCFLFNLQLVSYYDLVKLCCLMIQNGLFRDNKDGTYHGTTNRNFKHDHNLFGDVEPWYKKLDSCFRRVSILVELNVYNDVLVTCSSSMSIPNSLAYTLASTEIYNIFSYWLVRRCRRLHEVAMQKNILKNLNCKSVMRFYRLGEHLRINGLLSRLVQAGNLSAQFAMAEVYT